MGPELPKVTMWNLKKMMPMAEDRARDGEKIPKNLCTWIPLGLSASSQLILFSA